MLCSCMGFSHEELEEIIKEKQLTTVQAVQDETFAGTGCGKCLPVLDDMIAKQVDK